MSYQPQFTVTPRLLRMLEEIAAYREKILAATNQVPWIPVLQKDSRARSSHSSTAIEGNPLTLPEVRMLEDGKVPTAATERSKREILNYFAGLRYIEKHSKITPITHEDIFKLHALISSSVMDQGEAGRYRSIQVRVGNHLPPPPNQVSALMRELLEWWNKDSTVWSPVITSGILHYRFEAIHPFADGNGRTGRMLALWELYRRGFDTHHIFSVDEVYWEKRPTYYRNLDLVRTNGEDLTGWLEYTAEAIHLTLEQVWMRIQNLRTTKDAGKMILSPRQERLMGILKDKQHLTPTEIWAALKISKQGALNLLKPLLEAGLIRRIGTRKNGYYEKGE